MGSSGVGTVLEGVGSLGERKRQANQVGGRPVRRVLRLTEAEDLELVVAAEREGKSVQRFVVEAGVARARGVDPTHARESVTALFGVQHQLAKVGVNVNQLARHANATGVVLGAELEDQLQELRAVLARVDEVLDQVSLEARRG